MALAEMAGRPDVDQLMSELPTEAVDEWLTYWRCKAKQIEQAVDTDAGNKNKLMDPQEWGADVARFFGRHGKTHDQHHAARRA